MAVSVVRAEVRPGRCEVRFAGISENIAVALSRGTAYNILDEIRASRGGRQALAVSCQCLLLPLWCALPGTTLHACASGLNGVSFYNQALFLVSVARIRATPVRGCLTSTSGQLRPRPTRQAATYTARCVVRVRVASRRQPILKRVRGGKNHLVARWDVLQYDPPPAAYSRSHDGSGHPTTGIASSLTEVVFATPVCSLVRDRSCRVQDSLLGATGRERWRVQLCQLLARWPRHAQCPPPLSGS